MKTLTCNIHLLPTENYSPIVHSTNKYGGLFKSEYYSPMKDMGDSYQHLYLTIPQQEGVEISKIKENDWYINNDILFKADFFFDEGNNPNLNKRNEKIIATTNRELKVKGEQAGENAWFFPLPSIPKAFIEYFIEQYNKGNVVKTVEVEIRDNYCQQQNSEIEIVIPEIKVENNEVSIVIPTVNQEELHTKKDYLLKLRMLEATILAYPYRDEKYDKYFGIKRI